VLELKNQLGRMLAYQVVSDAAWLTANPSRGQLGDDVQQIQVAVTPASLSPGTHSASLRVEAEGVEIQQVPVTLTVSTVAGEQSGGAGTGSSGGSPTGDSSGLDVSPSELDFGSNGLTDTVFIHYAGSGELSYTVTADVPWVTFENAAGVAGNDYHAITVHADRSSLAPGTYVGELTVSAGASSLSSSWHLTVGSNSTVLTPVLYVTPTRLELGEEDDGATFEIRNTGTGTLEFSVASDATWAVVSPTSGTVYAEDQTIQVTTSRDGLEPGDYNGTIVVNSLDGQSRTIVIHMTAAPARPQLMVDVQRLDFGPTISSSDSRSGMPGPAR